MPRHPSVPDNQTGWIPLGTATTDTAMFAIVAPEMAGVLGDDWTARYIGQDGEPLPEPVETPEHELVQFEELEVGDHDTAVLFATHIDGGYIVEGKFSGAELIEVRMRLWACDCSCHDSDDGDLTCDGDCHDEDPPH